MRKPVKTHVGWIIGGLVVATACAARAGELTVEQLPPPPPPVETVPVRIPDPPPSQDPPPAVPVATPATPAAEPAKPAPVTLTPEEIRQRRSAIFLVEGVLVKAVRLAASRTASQMQLGFGMFTTAPARASGTYLEGYGVFFQVEIPSVVPTVASIMETLERDRIARRAQQANVANDVPTNPDAHYVESVKRQLIDAMLDHSKALDLRPDEWLTVAAREAEEAPGQIAEPSIMLLRVKGADLNDFLAGRLTREEVRKRVEIQGFSSY